MWLFCSLTIFKQIVKKKKKIKNGLWKMLFKFHSVYGLNGRVAAVYSLQISYILQVFWPAEWTHLPESPSHTSGRCAVLP